MTNPGDQCDYYDHRRADSNYPLKRLGAFYEFHQLHRSRPLEILLITNSPACDLLTSVLQLVEELPRRGRAFEARLWFSGYRSGGDQFFKDLPDIPMAKARIFHNFTDA